MKPEIPYEIIHSTLDASRASHYETDNIHPKNKIDVGNRLANVALNKVYRKDIISSGPEYDSFTIDNNKIIVKFKNTGKGLASKENKKIEGFAIAGADKKFYWAKAIIKNNTIILSSGNVKKPVAARYAWANNPSCNLINSEGLPAMPFRTDVWTVITQEK